MFRVGVVVLTAAEMVACSDSSGPREPTETRVAVASFGGLEIKILDSAGMPAAIISCGTQCKIRTAEWSRTGDMLAMTANVGTSSALFVVKADGSGIRELARVPATVLQGPKGSTQLIFHDFQPDWSSDDRIIYVNNGLIVSAADGSGKRAVLIANILRPKWAPRDSAVTYIDGTSFQLSTIRTDGMGARQLLTLPRSVTGHAWSPDGSKLAISTNASAEGALYVLDAKTMGLREIAGVSYGDSHCWSQDGRYLTFIREERAPVSNNGVTTAAITNSSDWTVTNLASTPVYRSNRAASNANGVSVFFFGFDTQVQEDALYVAAKSGGEPRRFTPEKGISYFSVSGARCSYLFNVI